MEIEQAHIEVIGRAKDFIYIETQFLRARSIVDALVEAARRQPELRLVLLLPSAPQEVLFDDATDSPHRHGEWLQIGGIDAVVAAYGERVGLYSLVNRNHHAPTDDRRSIDGHPVIYIHSKVCVIDHRLAIVSSANLNGRSLRWDTEAGVVWDEEAGVRAFEHRLWDAHLGSVFADRSLDRHGAELLALWNEAAQGGPSGAERLPYIAPFPYDAGRAFARKSWVVPDDLV
jgi:phospholipase D1/2